MSERSLKSEWSLSGETKAKQSESRKALLAKQTPEQKAERARKHREAMVARGIWKPKT